MNKQKEQPQSQTLPNKKKFTLTTKNKCSHEGSS